MELGEEGEKVVELGEEGATTSTSITITSVTQGDPKTNAETEIVGQYSRCIFLVPLR